MGYCADTVDIDFTIEADKVEAALAAIIERFGGEYETLADAVEELTSFQDCDGVAGEDFVLGYHCDKYMSDTDGVLAVLGGFAVEGAYVRFSGEDYSFFGFCVVGGTLRYESGTVVWSLDPEPIAASRDGAT